MGFLPELEGGDGVHSVPGQGNGCFKWDCEHSTDVLPPTHDKFSLHCIFDPHTFAGHVKQTAEINVNINRLEVYSSYNSRYCTYDIKNSSFL